ncbi:MAG: hypothetical protein ACYDE0_15575 [Acidiferrobacterales bacterium]
MLNVSDQTLKFAHQSFQAEPSIYYYGCSYHQNRGATVCANDHRERMPLINEAVVASIDKVLNPEVIHSAFELAFTQFTEQLRANPDRPREIEAELKKLRREVAARETQIEARGKERTTLSAAATPALDLREFRRAAEDRIGRFRDLLHDEVPLARQVLRKLLVEPITFKPVVANGRKTYAFKGKTRVGPLLDPGYIGMASPMGFVPCANTHPAFGGLGNISCIPDAIHHL